MLLLGYIISDVRYSDLENSFIEILNNVKECSKDIPKLIIGLEKAKEYAKDNGLEFDILNHTYSNGDRWTFKKTEKRNMYESDIESFKDYIKSIFVEKVLYYYINIYNLRYTNIKKLYNIIINNNNTKYIVIDNDMLYYYLDKNKVIGISFCILDYINISKEKIIDLIKSNKNNRICYSTSKNMWKYKDCFKGCEYVIPVILNNIDTNFNI